MLFLQLTTYIALSQLNFNSYAIFKTYFIPQGIIVTHYQLRRNITNHISSTGYFSITVFMYTIKFAIFSDYFLLCIAYNEPIVISKMRWMIILENTYRGNND